MLSYFVNEILRNNFETLVRCNYILVHCRTKWTKKIVPYGRFSNIYDFEENQKFQYNATLNESSFCCIICVEKKLLKPFDFILNPIKSFGIS